MRNVLYISLLLVFIAPISFGQVNYTYKALKSYQRDSLELAQSYIDTAITIPVENQDPQTWLIRGTIYFKLYRNVAQEESYLDVAEESYRRIIQLDSGKSELTGKAKTGLYNLSVQYYNTAVNTMNDKEYKQAEPNYKRYRELIKIARPNVDIEEKDIKFYNALGALTQNIYVSDKKGKPHMWQEAMDAYATTYALDSNNRSANYNIGILYYNRGVDLILSLPADAPMEKIFEVQDQTIELFLKSRPYLLRAYYLDPTDEEVLIGLKGIHYELNDKEQIEYWDKKLKELKDSGNK